MWGWKELSIARKTSGQSVKVAHHYATLLRGYGFRSFTSQYLPIKQPSEWLTTCLPSYIYLSYRIIILRAERRSMSKALPVNQYMSVHEIRPPNRYHRFYLRRWSEEQWAHTSRTKVTQQKLIVKYDNRQINSSPAGVIKKKIIACHSERRKKHQAKISECSMKQRQQDRSYFSARKSYEKKINRSRSRGSKPSNKSTPRGRNRKYMRDS